MTRASLSPGDHGACSRMLNTAWRARSEVGRVTAPGGLSIGRPRNSPDTMRNDGSYAKLTRAAPGRRRGEGLRAARLQAEIQRV